MTGTGGNLYVERISVISMVGHDDQQNKLTYLLYQEENDRVIIFKLAISI